MEFAIFTFADPEGFPRPLPLRTVLDKYNRSRSPLKNNRRCRGFDRHGLAVQPEINRLLQRSRPRLAALNLRPPCFDTGMIVRMDAGKHRLAEELSRCSRTK